MTTGGRKPYNRFLRKGRKRDFVFIHINKTAGTSIGKRLGIPTPVHFTAREAIERIGEQHWRQAYSFSIVRNPWAKTLSQYRYRVAVNKNGLADGHLAFRDWVARVYGETIDPAYHDEPRVFLPQSEWLKDPAGRIEVDFIGHFESLDRDFTTIAREIGVAAQLPRLNMSPPTDYRDWYDTQSAKRVARWFAEDVECFRYSY